jgi:uncharacterized protein YjiS (DUF1127 family)
MKALSLGPATGRVPRTAPQGVRRRVAGPSLRHVLSLVRYTLQQWGRRRRERAELARLDDRMLRDIGITRGDVWQEINKPFWRQ